MSEEVSLTACVPILRIFDEAKAREFYLDFLGFELEFEHRFADDAPLYMGLKRDGVTLHLTEHHGGPCPGSHVFVTTPHVAALQQELIGKQYKFMRPGLEEQPWGLTCTVYDPFGNHLIFWQPSDG